MARRNYRKSARSSTRRSGRSYSSRSGGGRRSSGVRGFRAQRVELVIRNETSGAPMIGPGIPGFHGLVARPPKPKQTF